MRPDQLLVVQRVRVQPLHEILKVFGARFGQVERGGAGFSEVVGAVEGGGEEGGDGAEGFLVDVEGVALGADGDGDDGFEKIAGRGSG